MLNSVVFLTLIIGFLHGEAQKCHGTARFNCEYGQDKDKPWVLFLEDSVKSNCQSGRCTAVLIAPQYILTTAHCLVASGRKTQIKYGCDSPYSRYCKTLCVQGRIIHPEHTGCPKTFLDGRTNDIAVAKLANPLTIIEPLPLPRTRKEQYLNNVSLIVEMYGVHKLVTVPVMESGGFTSEKIIVWHGKQIPYTVDTGDPLIYQNTLYGIGLTSLVHSGKPISIYINVNYFRDFIEDSIKILENL